jgi:lipopolysaccharide export system protein LptC
MASAATPIAMTARQRAALPGGRRDAVMRLLKWLLPLLAMLLLATILLWPLVNGQEFSFVLAKDQVAMARERLRVDKAEYRGQTVRGEAFTITAASAVQQNSANPVVELDQLSARLEGVDGPAMATAPSGRYFLNEDRLQVSGPVRVMSANGYALDSETVDVNLASRQVHTRQPVQGSLPMGTFRADALDGDLAGQKVVLAGNVRLHIARRKG